MLNIFVTGLYPLVLVPVLALNSSYATVFTLFTLCAFADINAISLSLHLTSLHSDFLLWFQ